MPAPWPPIDLKTSMHTVQVHTLDVCTSKDVLYFKQVKQSHSPPRKTFFPCRKWRKGRFLSARQALIHVLSYSKYLAVPSTMKRCITGAIFDPIPSSTSNILFSTFSTAFWMRVMRVRRQDRTTASPFSDEAWREPKISSIPENSKYAYQTLTSFKWPRGMGRLSGSLESHKIQENENYLGAMRFKTPYPDPWPQMVG